MKDVKTNAMRILDKNKIPYDVLCYEAEIDGEYIPLSFGNCEQKIGVKSEKCFKTIVTRAKSGNYYVFMLPVDKELDLKKCASSVKEKSVETIAVKDLLPLTGYIRGGCSPIGMKKLFTTTIHSDCDTFDKIVFSAGKRGVMVHVGVDDLKRLIRAQSADITF